MKCKAEQIAGKFITVNISGFPVPTRRDIRATRNWKYIYLQELLLPWLSDLLVSFRINFPGAFHPNGRCISLCLVVCASFFKDFPSHKERTFSLQYVMQSALRFS